MKTEAFLNSLRDEIVERNAMTQHPLMKMIYAGELSKEQVAGWAKQFWVIPHTHLINNAGKLAHAHLWHGSSIQQLLESPYDRDITDKLGDSILDEMGHSDISPQNHYDCYFKLTDELGIPREEMGKPLGLTANSVLVMYGWAKSALEFSLLELIASHNYVNDYTNTIAYPMLCKALMNHYGVSREGVTWFDLHGEVDKEHGAMSRYVLTRLIRSEEDRRVVRHATRFGIGIKWALFDGVMNAYVTGSYKI